MADFGAEVIRVEYDQTLDVIRGAGATGDNPNTSGLFNNLNRNKLGVTLNVMHPRGMEIAHELISVSDIVVENFSASVLERWGLDYEAQRAIRPDVIYVSMSGFGHSGRDQEERDLGPTAQAISGLSHMSGLPGEAPAAWGFSYMDHIAGYHGVIACVTALHHRNRTGEGQWVDLSQVESGSRYRVRRFSTGRSTVVVTAERAIRPETGHPSMAWLRTAHTAARAMTGGAPYPSSTKSSGRRSWRP